MLVEIFTIMRLNKANLFERIFYFMRKKHKKHDRWNSIFSAMKKGEDNDFVYKKWFGSNGVVFFKEDLKSYPPGLSFISKIDSEKPFSPQNFKWVVLPVKQIIRKPKKQREYIDCLTLKIHIKKDTDLSKSGIYKLSFSNGQFYIGSTSNLKIRLGCFATMFKGASKFHNKKMIIAVTESNSAEFEVLEYIFDSSILKERETATIKKYFNNPLLINRSHDANSNKGIRWTDEEKNKTRNTLVKKFNEGLLTAPVHRKKIPSGTFKSKYFGDKE